MGQSTDAIHFYGVPIDDGTEAAEIVDRWYNSEEVDGDSERWFKARDLPLTIGYHCSDRYVMYYLAVADSEVRAYRGSPMRVGTPVAPQHWDMFLRAGLLAVGLTSHLDGHYPSKPFDWYMVSWWSG